MIRIFMTLSGNLGDTVNVFPVLSGIYKSTGYKISIIIKDRMRMFYGFKEFMEMQDCIGEFKYESEISDFRNTLFLSPENSFEMHSIRPWETVRLDTDLKNKYNLSYEVDDDFVLNVPNVSCPTDNIIVGDRMRHPDMDNRRASGILEDSGKFSRNEYFFLDYKEPISKNIAYIKASPKIFISTFTGISILADLMLKEQIVLYDDVIAQWDNKPIDYSYNKHYYRNRKSKLLHLNDI